MSKNVSIEYAHIYTNNKIDEEHQKSLSILSELDTELKDQTKSLVVMIDDYSFPDPTFDYDEFSQWLADHRYTPDVIIRESQLIPVCDQVLRLIEKQKLKEGITDYIISKKYPCSLFIAAWYLVRLGHLEWTDFPKELTASTLVNILPESFKPFEEKGIEIIRSTKFAAAADTIEYRFFEGRMIA